MEGNCIAHAEAKWAALNLGALARRQTDLAAGLQRCLEGAGLPPPPDAPVTALTELWREVLDHPGPRLVFGAGALCAYPGGGAGRGVSLVVDRSAQALAAALRDAALWVDLEAGRLMLANPQSEFELIEEAKRLLTSGDEPATPFLAFTPGLVPEEAETYRRWGESVLRFLEFCRDPKVLNLEMYARFKLVADRIHALGADGLRVLDVGGREWVFSAFLPRYRVTVADLETTGLDGRALPFPPRSFDIVTAHHLLEHVPDGDRLDLLAELVRVAKRRVYLTGPFSESPFAAEIYRLLSQLAPENPYLQEHLRLGLPSLARVEAWLDARGLPYAVEPITRCNTWLLALALTPLQESRPEIYREVTRYYNRRFQELDRGEPSYQSLIEIRVS